MGKTPHTAICDMVDRRKNPDMPVWWTWIGFNLSSWLALLWLLAVLLMVALAHEGKLSSNRFTESLTACAENLTPSAMTIENSAGASKPVSCITQIPIIRTAETRAGPCSAASAGKRHPEICAGTILPKSNTRHLVAGF